jgi:integrase
MARKTTPLTNTQVKQAKPREKEYNLADGQGLYLRVKPNGSKLWIFNYYRPFTKARANLSFGTYPDLSIAKAREMRTEARELLAQDIDPKSHREELERGQKAAMENTLGKVCKQWLTLKQSKVSADHAKDIYRSLELHILDKLGKKPIHQIKAPVVIDILQPLAAKGSLETVRRVCQRINEVMGYAVNTGLIDNNPLAKISEAFEAPKKQHMATLPPDQLPTLMKAIANASIKRTTRCLILWQLHTMTRPGEAAGTRWDEIDLENAVWTIPGERMKKGKEHTVPLSPQCLAILETMREISGNREHVFPSDRNPRSHANPSTANMALKRMKFGGKLVSHGLRALASTTLNEQEFAPDIIEAALAHVDKNEVRRAYNRAQYLEQRRKMMEWWSQHIDQAATSNMDTIGGKCGLRIVTP